LELNAVIWVWTKACSIFRGMTCNSSFSVFQKLSSLFVLLKLWWFTVLVFFILSWTFWFFALFGE
jgi:hypothetical protein